MYAHKKPFSKFFKNQDCGFSKSNLNRKSIKSKKFWIQIRIDIFKKFESKKYSNWKIIKIKNGYHCKENYARVF